MSLKLTIELVPRTAWFSNLRTIISKNDWDRLRRGCYRKSSRRCEICGGVGKDHPVECHEIWEYDDTNLIQKLIGLVALCPQCHEVKHIGFANANGRGYMAMKHLMKINEWSEDEARSYIIDQFRIWEVRSSKNWEIDLEWIDNQGIEYNKQL